MEMALWNYCFSTKPVVATRLEFPVHFQVAQKGKSKADAQDEPESQAYRLLAAQRAALPEAKVKVAFGNQYDPQSGPAENYLLCIGLSTQESLHHPDKYGAAETAPQRVKKGALSFSALHFGGVYEAIP